MEKNYFPGNLNTFTTVSLVVDVGSLLFEFCDGLIFGGSEQMTSVTQNKKL